MEYITLYILFSMAATVWFDVTRYTIPNWLNASLLVLYPVAVYLSPHGVDWKMALAAMGVVFVVGYIIFSAHVMGGGDVKLITVLALWVGWLHLLDFVILFAILGGIFTLGLIVARKMAQVAPIAKLPKVLEKNGPVPYGVAIAAAFVWMMWQGKIPMLSAL